MVSFELPTVQDDMKPKKRTGAIRGKDSDFIRLFQPENTISFSVFICLEYDF
jgi:hypothetical protein